MKMLSSPASKSMLSTDTMIDQSSTDSSASSNNNKTSSSNKQGPLVRDPICRPWSQCTTVLHNLIRRFVVVLSGHAARNPKSYVVGITVLSLAAVATGLFTNFRVEVDYDIIYAPRGSRPTEHMNWIYNEAGFPEGNRPITLVVHNNGNNVMGKQGVEQVFEALEVLQSTAGYSEICAQSSFAMSYPNGTQTEDACNIIGVARYWYYNQAFFQEKETTDRQVIETISNETYPDGIPVNHDFVLGNYEWTNETQVYNHALGHVIPLKTDDAITYAESFIETILLPDVEGAAEYESAVIENLLQLQEKWRKAAEAEEAAGLDSQTRTYQVEFVTQESYSTEFERAIFKDLPLTFMVAAIMVCFTCIVFFKRDKIQSRSLLGISSVHTITMSVFMGFGLMFMIGIPFTNMTMMLPFVVYGVGLDDTFIITGAYFRTDPKKDVVDRIQETMEEVGLSISLTTTTTMLAFGLGYISSIPAIQWLCLYAFTTIGFDFIFQITLFTAFVVLDERRVQANRRDMCFCIKVEREEDDGNTSDQPKSNCNTDQESECNTAKDEQTVQSEADEQPDLSLRFMTWYADFLMRPSVKAAVLALFTGFCGLCIYSTTQLTQEFIISEFLPSDSFVSTYLSSVNQYADEMVPLGIYFRHLNQSDADVQQHMRDYIDDLMELEQLDMRPPVCWVRDFHEQTYSEDIDFGVDLELLSFNDQLTLAMTDPRIMELYGDDIVRDENGDVVSSRCWVYLRNVDFDVVQSQIDMLNDQRAVSATQPLNQGKQDWSMFTFTDLMFLWEFYTIAVDELTLSTIMGVVAVTVVAFLLMPHFSAILFVFPTICILYVDLLGTLQLAGLHINVVTYVCLTVSIGLLVDFIMHVLLRYYESEALTREEKVKDTLKTMGVSILVGGLSTFLAVIPLAFSTSVIIRTVFTAFFAMVTLGVSHGLIFLPVVLSLLGPTTMTPQMKTTTSTVDTDSDQQSSSDEECQESSSSPPVSHDIDDPNFVEICV